MGFCAPNVTKSLLFVITFQFMSPHIKVSKNNACGAFFCDFVLEIPPESVQ